MKHFLRIGTVFVAMIATAVGSYFIMRGAGFDILQPGGHIAERERDIIIFVVSLAGIIVIPVFAMLFLFGWRYRDRKDSKAVYKPDWAHNNWLEAVWWGIPIIIVLILAVMTWLTTHELDPYKKLDKEVSDKDPVEVQVVALEWKWLFIYPEEGVASAGRLMIPEDTPINFTITSDAAMNSFWIPSLGSQIYAMSAMSTELSLIAKESGDYRGYSANISGEGFAGMKFIARATSQDDFDAWVKKTAKQPKLNVESYQKLSERSILDKPKYYTLADDELYDKIVDKYMYSDKKFQEVYGESKSSMPGHKDTVDNADKKSSRGGKA